VFSCLCVQVQGFLLKAQREHSLLAELGSAGASRDPSSPGTHGTPCGMATPETDLLETRSKEPEEEEEEEEKEKSVKGMDSCEEEHKEVETKEKPAGREIFTLDIPEYLLPDQAEGDAGERFFARRLES